jgi:hypothetical protein
LQSFGLLPFGGATLVFGVEELLSVSVQIRELNPTFGGQGR